MKTISIIRDRGQLTIPDSIRKNLYWTAPMSAITITSDTPNEIIIRPHQSVKDPAKVWALIKRSRANKGKLSRKGSTVDFIEKDRLSH